MRLVYVLGPEFTGYSAGADWQDAKLGVHHLSAWERAAVVSDVEWVEHLVGAFAWLIPGELRRFSLAERDEAVELGRRHRARARAGARARPEPIARARAARRSGRAGRRRSRADPRDAAAGAEPAGRLRRTEPVSSSAPPTPSDWRPATARPTVPPAVPEQWAADPSGRHQHRWWNGREWTEHVADNGVSGIDPLG